MIRKALFLLLAAAEACCLCLFLSSPVQGGAQALAVNGQGEAACTVWGAAGAAALFSACAFSILTEKKDHTVFPAALCLTAAFSYVFARVFYCLVRPDRYFYGRDAAEALLMMLNVREGGFLYSGAAAGAAAACLTASLLSKRYSFSGLAEKLLCPFLFVTAVLFAAELYTSAGRGPAAGDGEAVFPFTVSGRFGKARYAVCLYECAIQLLMLIACLILRDRGKRALRAAVLLIAALRVPLITLNTGDICTLGFLPFTGSGFVKTECALSGLVLLSGALRASIRGKGKTALLRFPLCAVFIACGILCIWAMDKTGFSNLLLYILLTLSVIAAALCTLWKKSKK